MSSEEHDSLAELDFELEVPTIKIETKAFSADVIEMYEMPNEMIMKMLSVHGPRQMFQMMDLFKLAVIDPRVSGQLELLSFNEMTEVVGQWAAKSSMRWLELGVVDKRPAGVIDPPLNDNAGVEGDDDDLYDFDEDDSFEWD